MPQTTRKMLNLTVCFLPLFLAVTARAQTVAVTPQNGATPTLPATPANYRRLADEVEANLQQHVLAMWFPRAVDRRLGGFWQNFNEDWSRGTGSGRAVVYQSRLTWLAAQAALRYPQRAAEYADYSQHGLNYLLNTLWDKQSGGLFWSVDENGQAVERNGEKHVYGIAFGIYAASANFHATRDPRALDLAKRTFVWLDAHAHDARNGGYYEALTRAGRPILAPPATPTEPQSDFIGTRYGFKSMNTHIHLLEAFTALHEIWPDAALRARLQEVFNIVRDKIVVESVGAMHLFFTPQWQPVPDHDSFGHDVETAYLLIEAAHALGRRNDTRTWAAARRLVDHALDWGWDEENGGFYDAGGAFSSPRLTDEKATEKIWWVQAEGLNALLLMHGKYGRQSPRYWHAFMKQWQFIRDRQTDNRNGGWQATTTREGASIAGRAKSDAWTEGYHQGRALLNVSTTLRQLAKSAP